MRELVAEVLLRLVKPLVALALGIIAWLVVVGPLGAQPTVELALLCWLGGSAFVLLAQESPL